MEQRANHFFHFQFMPGQLQRYRHGCERLYGPAILPGHAAATIECGDLFDNNRL
jgi:hypothetical protein